VVAHELKSYGVRTFSAKEMAFNILGLMHGSQCAEGRSGATGPALPVSSSAANRKSDIRLENEGQKKTGCRGGGEAAGQEAEEKQNREALWAEQKAKSGYKEAGEEKRLKKEQEGAERTRKTEEKARISLEVSGF